MAADITIRIFDGNVGCCHPHFTCRADAQDGQIVSVFPGYRVQDIIIPLSSQFRLFSDSHPFPVDMERIKDVFLGKPFNNERANANWQSTRRGPPALLSLMYRSGAFAPAEVCRN